MKLTTLSAALLLSTTACGSVVGTDDVDVDSDAIYGDEASDIETPEAPAAKPSPLLLESPRAATTNRSLFGMTFANNAPIANLMTEADPADVIEQRIVNTSTDEVQLEIDVTQPTGTYSRVIVTDTINMGPRAVSVLCEQNGAGTFDPRCETVPPTSRELPASGAITSSRWMVWVLDETTNQTVPTCFSFGPRLTCVLPARALASYRIIASAHGFTDLWNGAGTIGQQFIGSDTYVGTPGAPEYQCAGWRFPDEWTSYCETVNEFARFTAVDRARLEFDPITLTVTADDSAPATMSSPALVWDAGNDDVPGVY